MLELKRIRMEKGMSIHALSRASGVSRPTIYKLEGGADCARTKTLKALADALGVKITEFFSD